MNSWNTIIPTISLFWSLLVTTVKINALLRLFGTRSYSLIFFVITVIAITEIHWIWCKGSSDICLVVFPSEWFTRPWTSVSHQVSCRCILRPSWIGRIQKTGWVWPFLIGSLPSFNSDFLQLKYTLYNLEKSKLSFFAVRALLQLWEMVPRGFALIPRESWP
jgi:hypothetical protein